MKDDFGDGDPVDPALGMGEDCEHSLCPFFDRGLNAGAFKQRNDLLVSAMRCGFLNYHFCSGASQRSSLHIREVKAPAIESQNAEVVPDSFFGCACVYQGGQDHVA
jgi:hypothetical protein